MLVQCTDCWNVLSSGIIQWYSVVFDKCECSHWSKLNTTHFKLSTWEYFFCVYWKHLLSFALIIFWYNVSSFVKKVESGMRLSILFEPSSFAWIQKASLRTLLWGSSGGHFGYNIFELPICRLLTRIYIYVLTLLCWSSCKFQCCSKIRDHLKKKGGGGC